MIPDGKNLKAQVLYSYYRDGHIVTEYRVSVPDFSISGDYRHELVMTKTPAEHQSW